MVIKTRMTWRQSTMLKIVLVLVIVGIVGMLGWTVYEFASSSDNGGNDDMVGNGNMITSPPPNPEDIEESDEVGTELGQMAPDFELETLEEDTVVRLSDLQGERVIVNFWATWCAPCREEIPDFQKLYDSEDVEILAVNMTESEKSEDDVIEFLETSLQTHRQIRSHHLRFFLAVNMTESEKSEDDVIEFVDEFAMTFPVLLDVDSEVSETYQVQAYPTTYMIDSNGHIQYIAMGPMDYDLMAEQLEKME